MTRFALRLEYDGAGFVGWQRQAAGISVQQVLEDAAARLEGSPVASIVAGRTDAGVHALGQVAHLDFTRDIAPDALARALNFHMKPHRVVVTASAIVPAEWSARLSAVRRVYRYIILNRWARPALQAGQVWHVPTPLDAAAMAEGARHLLGKHDFTSFRATSCQAKSPLRTLDVLDVARDGERIVIRAEARSFLHHQVRNMVGTLKLVGEGRWQPARMAAALRAANRAAAGPTAPAEGLFLMRVDYGSNPFQKEELLF
ncbi:MAG TPA: tRNA pseudouridine(38-40) synthase TruA [Acetobacteraceae bacterium]|nr:tRNA pseudouridine(38-40) synthase TruA [Acetobacteraceae bacterium]